MLAPGPALHYVPYGCRFFRLHVRPDSGYTRGIRVVLNSVWASAVGPFVRELGAATGNSSDLSPTACTGAATAHRSTGDGTMW
jgi:hypothetical protein